jgi:hypothetical protein
LQRETVASNGNGGASELEAGLGKLVKFDQRIKAANPGSSMPGSAQILIFTGVRYERGTSQPPNKRLDPTRPKRKRG